MSLGQGARQRNVNLSIFKRISDAFDAGGYAGHVYYQDALADPTRLDSRNTAQRYWVELHIVNEGFGLGTPTVAQVDGYYHVGDELQSSADRYGHNLTGVMDALIASLTHSNNGFYVYDFSTTPLTPTISDDWVIVQNSRGRQGWPESRRRWEPDAGIQRETMILHVWGWSDLMPGVQLYF